jgi:hypothetical protein
MNKLLLIIYIFISTSCLAQGPEVTSWIINTTGATGYGSIPSNIQQVQYSANNVYVSATCVPSYNIGPWPGNPNVPVNQNFVYKITRNPVQNTGTPVAVALGHIGVWSNGVSIFNAKDAMSYNNQGVWNQNAYFFEGASFDNCLGHPAPNGEYHHHVNPTCLYNDADSTQHAPIIGYAFDGFPVYGAYGYTNTNGTGAIKRMVTSYVLNTGTTRTNGPAVSGTYPLGCYIEDYTYVQGSGDLDEHNGRYCVTPEYPAGIYAYFVTIDAALNPVFPYTLGATYYGTVQAGNTGPNSGHNTISEPVTTYTPSGINNPEQSLTATLFPNPASDFITVHINPVSSNNFTARLTDAQGKLMLEIKNIQPSIYYTIPLKNIAAGIYFLQLRNDELFSSQKIIIR